MHGSQVQGSVPLLKQKFIPGEIACAEEHTFQHQATGSFLEAFSLVKVENRHFPVLSKAYQLTHFK